MAKKTYIEKLKSSADGNVHLASIGPSDMYTTACGTCDDIGINYLETNEPLSCLCCVSLYGNIKDGITTIKR